jgi:4-hydroxy-2-oxoheptanedioate aldolase
MKKTRPAAPRTASKPARAAASAPSAASKAPKANPSSAKPSPAKSSPAKPSATPRPAAPVPPGASARTFASLAPRLGGGSGLLTGWVGLPDPLVAGLMAREDVDAVTLDMQHGAVDLACAIRAIPHVLVAEKPVIVRIPVGEFATASRLLDAGASGIIAPMVNSVEDARALVAFTKFPPLGQRSWGPALALNISGLTPNAYLAQANALTVTLAMVETREAMDALDAILGVEGIDGVLVGPSDLSIALSGGAHVDAGHPEVWAALDHTVRRCRALGKVSAVFAANGERAREMRQRGFDLVALANDTMQLRAGVKAMAEIARRD